MTAADVLKIIRAERDECIQFRDGFQLMAMPHFNNWDAHDILAKNYDKIVQKITKAMRAERRRAKR